LADRVQVAVPERVAPARASRSGLIQWCTKNGVGNGAVFVLPTDLTTCRDVLQLEATRRLATREGWRYQHVQAIIVAIHQYAEAATANRDFFTARSK
jgi:hypothetical protein